MEVSKSNLNSLKATCATLVTLASATLPGCANRATDSERTGEDPRLVDFGHSHNLAVELDSTGKLKNVSTAPEGFHPLPDFSAYGPFPFRTQKIPAPKDVRGY